MFKTGGYFYISKCFGLITILVFLWMEAFSQAPLGINYQGVARNPDGSPQVNQAISLRVSILAEGLNGLSEYVETHAVTTNQFGLFTIVIGQGEHTGSLQDVDWQTGNKWLQIEMDMRGGSNFEMVGTQQIFSVPYAMYASQSGTGMTAGDGIDVTGGVISNTKPDKPVSLLGAGTVNVSGTYPDYVITGIEGQQTLSEVLMQDNDAGNMRIRNLAEPVSNQDVATKSYVDSRNVDDADADPTNEIQNAAQVAVTPTGNLTSTQVQLALEELQADIDADLDADPANEIQVLTKTGNQVDLSNGGGSFIDEVDDADADATNELVQSVTLMGTNLEITDAGGTQVVDLSSLQDGTGTDSQTLSSTFLTADTRDLVISGGNNITLDVSDNDNSSSNELQTISKVGSTVTLSNSGGSFTDAVDDADANPTNEIQDLSLTGNTLSLTNDASTVDLSGYLDNTDNQNLSSTTAGTNRTINISGGTGTTISVADNDNSTSNELITGATYEPNNTLRITDAGGDTDIALGTLNADMNANTNRIINVADPIDPGDAVNLSFLETKDATDYAFKSIINDTGTGSALTFDLSVFDFDEGGLISVIQISIPESGIYLFNVKGSSTSNAPIVINVNNFTDYTVGLINVNTYSDTILLKLNAGDIVELRANSTTNGENFTLEFFGYKI